MRKAAAFTQADVERVLKAVQRLGLTVSRLEVSRDGNIVALFDQHSDENSDKHDWDKAIRAQKERAASQRDGVSRPTRKYAPALPR